MEHEEIRARFSEYIDGALSPEEKASIEDHLRSCESCRDDLAELRSAVLEVRKLGEVEPPPWLAQRIMARVREEAQEKQGLFHRLLYPLRVKLPLDALAFVVLAVTGLFIYRAIEPRMKTPSPVKEPSDYSAVDAPQTAEEKRAAESPETTIYESRQFSETIPRASSPLPASEGLARGIGEGARILILLEDAPASSREVEKAIEHSGGKMLSEEDRGKKRIIRVQIESSKMAALLERMRSLGRAIMTEG
jgi:hypothetical protein